MRFLIDVDTGGTFTHGCIAGDGEVRTVTTPTTPHDSTVCLTNCVQQGAEAFGISLRDMLVNADIVRYSTTIATNALVERTGSKIGLIVTREFERSLYAPQAIAESVHSLLSEDMIASVEEEIDERGSILRPLNRDEVIEKLQLLIDRGAKVLVVSLRNSNINPAHEKAAKQIIKEEYPSFYLGSMRVFLSSEVSDQPGEYYRTTSALIDSYVHDVLAKYLYKAEDNLRSNHYTHPLMICNSRGGVARVAKTKAIDTYNSGPVAGLCAASYLGRLYDCGNIVTADIGGTTVDVGIIRNGSYSYQLLPKISGVTVNVPMIDVYSVGLAGGSIASVNDDGNIQIGPRSAGARPGPACFDLGGAEPTVTDADVVLGLIDPGYFLGGRMKLNKDKATSTIQRKIAGRLNTSVPEAAYLIRENADAAIQKAMISHLALQGISPDDLTGFISVVYGGAGPTHCCGFNRGLPFAQTVISPFASAFSAFGSSMADLLHSYSRFSEITVYDGASYLNNFAEFNGMVDELLVNAQRDIRGEGYPVESARYYLELTMGDEGIRVKTDLLQLSSEADVRGLCAQYRRAKKLMDEDSGKIVISTIGLNAVIQMPHYQFKSAELGEQDPRPAYKGEREVFWSVKSGFFKTSVYDRALLSPGNMVTGPAIVEARDTTYVIPSSYSLTIDKYSNAVIKEVRK